MKLGNAVVDIAASSWTLDRIGLVCKLGCSLTDSLIVSVHILDYMKYLVYAQTIYQVINPGQLLILPRVVHGLPLAQQLVQQGYPPLVNFHHVH